METEFNGHMISGQGIKSITSNIEVIMNAKRPQKFNNYSHFRVPLIIIYIS